MANLLRKIRARRAIGSQPGFTLLEMLVGLIIGTIIVGGVMGLISVSLRHSFQIREKSEIQPILESAAQMIFADPQRAADGSISLTELPGNPIVAVSLAPVELGEKTAGTQSGGLYRVMLSYRTGRLEFSLIVPDKT